MQSSPWCGALRPSLKATYAFSPSPTRRSVRRYRPPKILTALPKRRRPGPCEMTFLYKADTVRGAQWARLFAEKAPDIPFRIWPDGSSGDDAHAVRYLAVWEPPRDLATAFPNLELVFSVGAGIDQFDLSAIPAHLPVVRMIEPGIVAGMVEYTTLATLALH